MYTTTLIITNKLGLHARPSAKIAETANRFKANITIDTQGKSINAKSIMNIMMLAASQGTELTITADGADEKEAVTTLENLFKSNFDEKE